MKNIVFLGIAMLFFTGPILAKNPKKEVFSESIEPVYGFSGWNRKQPITIQSSQVSGTSDLLDFPVLITLDHLNSEIVDGGGHSALNGGGDIRFSSDAAGNNQLPIEVVEFVTSATPSNRKCQIWVKVPNVSASNNTTIYIWYNKAGEVQPAKSSTYGSQAVWSNYHFVSHDGLYDSASNQYLTVNGTPTTGITPYGGASWKGNGTTDYNYMSSSGLDLSGNLSISVWKKNTAPTTNFGTSLTARNGSGWFILRSYGTTSRAGRTFFSSEPPTATNGEGAYMTPVSDQLGWHYFSVSQTTSSGENELMRGDGDATPNSPTTSYSWSRPSISDYITVGNGSPNNNNELNGELAELRISETVISADFSDTEYQNQSNPAAFAVAGTPESVSGGEGDSQSPTAPTLSTTSHTDTTVDISWNGATDNVGVTGYKIFKDGALEATLGAVSTHQITGLTASTTYDFMIRALDAAGNESSPSNIVTMTTNAVSGGGGNSGSVWAESGSTASYNGNVAMGTAAVPSGYRVAIDGKLITEEVKVQMSGNWPDYVFEEGYELTPLEEVKKYIEERGHLPNIPSAGEVEANGVELGEMNRLLLEKIEELTLYLIELKRENMEQQTQINVLKGEK